jgi:hypothetical protein
VKEDIGDLSLLRYRQTNVKGDLAMNIRSFTRTVIVSVCILFGIVNTGCNESITGSPMVFSIDKAGFVRDRDQYLTNHYITEADVVTISLNTLFIKYIKQDMSLGGNQLLVYSEVYDSPEDARPYSTIIFNQKHQPENAILGLVDRVIYGPAKFKGYPIRIKLFVVELDKKDNELTKRILQSIGEVVSTAQPELGPAVGVGVAFGNILSAFNEDDYELRADITFHPTSCIPYPARYLEPNDLGLGSEVEEDRAEIFPQFENAKNLPLRSGHYLVSKVEGKKRFLAEDISQMYEYLPTDSFEYSEDWGESEKVLLYKGGYLWLDTFELERGEYVISEVTKYTEKTYAILAVRHGGQEGNEAKMRAVAKTEFEAIKGLLQEDNHREILAGFESIGKNIAADIMSKQIVNTLNKRVARQSDFRKKPEFLIGYIRELISNEENSKGKRIIDNDKMGEAYAARLNASLLRIIESTCVDFPLSSLLDSDNWSDIERIKKEAMDEGRITLKEGTEGLFVWNKEIDS